MRLQYVKIVEYLLVNCEWPYDYIKHALKETSGNAVIQKMLKRQLLEIGKKDKKVCQTCSSCFII